MSHGANPELGDKWAEYKVGVSLAKLSRLD